MTKQRICPACGLPMYEDATDAEIEQQQFCSPLRCDAWERVRTDADGIEHP